MKKLIYLISLLTALSLGAQISTRDWANVGIKNIGEADVEFFGAVGDGTTDDTAAIQRAIDWAESQKPLRGGIVRLGPKQYLVTAPLVIDDEGVTIQGSGTRFFSLATTSSILGNHTTGPVIHVKASSTRLRGFRVDSLGARLPTGAYDRTTQDYANPAIGTGTGRNDGIHIVAPNNGAATTERVNYIIIEEMHVRGQPGSGLILTGDSVGVEIKSSVFEYNNSHGIYIGGGDEAGYTWNAGDRVGLGEIVNSRSSSNGGHNLLMGDVIASRVWQPYRWTIQNLETFKGGLTPSVSGVDDGAGNAAFLTDTTASWTVNQFVGKTISNTTDGSTGYITANTATTITATLSGGTDDDWDVSDAYLINNLERDGNGGNLDYDVILLGENIEYIGSATSGRGTGLDTEGNGILVGGRNIKQINNRYINTYRPTYLAETADTTGILKLNLGINGEGYTVDSPLVSSAALTGTAQAGAATTITLASTASAVDDHYNNAWIDITSGTGSGEGDLPKLITDYTGSTKVATVAAWTTAPDATSVYSIQLDPPIGIRYDPGVNGLFQNTAYTGGVTQMTEEEATIASGAIDWLYRFHRVDTEADAATDNLDTITGGRKGDMVTLSMENASRVVTVRHIGGGSGNIRLKDSHNFTFLGIQDKLTLMHDGTRWIEVYRNQILSTGIVNVQDFGARGYADALTGTITSTGTAVVGTGTAFTTQLAVNDWIKYELTLPTRYYVAKVASITDATNLTLDVAFQTDASGASFERIYDAAPGIQAALDFVFTGTSPARRGKVLIPPGEYFTGSTITVGGASVELEGLAGELATKIISYDLSGAVINLSARRQALRNVDLDATEERYAEQWQDFDHGLVIEAADTAANYPTHIELENVYVQNQPGSGIVVSGGAWFSKMERITIRDSKAHGLVFTDGTYPTHLDSIATDGAITAATATLDGTVTPVWTAAHVGDWVRVVGAGTAGADLITTIATFTDADTVELTDNASTTVSGATIYYLSRTNQDVPSGIADLNLVEIFDNDGHGMLLGNPLSSDTQDRAIRMQLRNVDVGRNAQAAGPRLVAAQLYGFMDTSVITHSAFDGKNKVGSDATTRAIEIHGKNIKIQNNRIINPTPQAIKVGGTVDSFTTENIVIEDNYLIKGATVTWPSPTIDRAILVATGAAITNMVNRRWSGTALMDAENPDGTTDGNLVNSHETVVQYLLEDEAWNTDTTLAVLTSDKTTSTPGLYIPLQKSQKATFDVFLYVDGDATADAKVAITVPASAILRWSPAGGLRIAADDSVTQQDLIQASGTAVAFGTHATNDRMIHLKGYVHTQGTAGNIEVHVAQNASVASDITFRAGSYIALNK